MINYSIIIPHKNSADCLEYCLSTIPVREDVQVIVVDDNSDADKVDFKNFPQWKGVNYVYYLTKEGKGAGYVRNVGLEHAVGKWVLFMDADDFLLPTINDIMDECVNSEADIIYFRPQAVMLDDRKTFSNRADGLNNIISNYFLTREENNLRCRFMPPWSKIVRRKFLEEHNIRFEEIKYSNDVLFSVKMGCAAHVISVLDKSYYVVTECNNSLAANYNNKPGELQIRSDAFFNASKHIIENGFSFNLYEAMYYLERLIMKDNQRFATYFMWTLSQSPYDRVKLLYEIFRWDSVISCVKKMLYGFWLTTNYRTIRTEKPYAKDE